MTEKKYLGPNEVLGVTVVEQKTPAGAEMVKVMYESSDLPLGTVEVMPKQTYELLISDQPRDWTWVRDTQSKRIQEDLAKVLMEWDVSYTDVKHVVLGLTDKIYTAFDRATSFLWTKDDTKFVPGTDNPVGFRTLLEAEEILKGVKTDEPKPTNN